MLRTAHRSRIVGALQLGEGLRELRIFCDGFAYDTFQPLLRSFSFAGDLVRELCRQRLLVVGLYVKLCCCHVSLCTLARFRGLPHDLLGHTEIRLRL